jgi:hypothetical protein
MKRIIIDAVSLMAYQWDDFIGFSESSVQICKKRMIFMSDRSDRIRQNDIYQTGTVSVSTALNMCPAGTSDFDAQMSGIKFWKGDENLRHVYKKTVSRNIEHLLSFWIL